MGEVGEDEFVGCVEERFAVLASDSSLSGALGGISPANGSSAHERPLHVHRHRDELQMAGVAGKPPSGRGSCHISASSCEGALDG
jgi:hypothetical protein